jgi:anthraniloyl-CoA monooxygenase
MFADVFKPDIVRECKFVWLGTHQKFDDAFTFIFEKTEHGWVWAHAYQFDDDTATFIVECTAGDLGRLRLRRHVQEESIETCERSSRSIWAGTPDVQRQASARLGLDELPRVLCEKWYHENVVLMGDAAATAHFSIGSGSKLAFDSAIALADYLHSEPTHGRRFERYQEERRSRCCACNRRRATRRMVRGGRALSRSRPGAVQLFAADPVAADQPREPAPARSRMAERGRAWFQRRPASRRMRRCAPMFAPFKLRDMELKNRIVVSPMAQYKAVDGCPTDWHLIHYGERAKGGAGLVYTEMTCVSPEGRITPGCPGLYAPEHEAAWKRLTDFVHAETRREDLLPDRPFRAQGLDPAGLGGDGRAAEGGQLG